MRITVALDDDVAAMIEALRKRSGARRKQVVNEALRRGLAQMAAPDPPRTPYRTPARSLGRCLAGSLDNIAEVLAAIEGEDYR
jgi:hypothetical protein